MKTALGLLEWKSIAKAIETTDVSLKSGAVDLVLSQTLCCGKFVSIFTGEIDAVRQALETGADFSAPELVDQVLIPHAHPKIVPAFMGTNEVEVGSALGVIETMSVVGAVNGADAALKAASVDVVEIRMAQGLGGKAFALLTGEVAAMQTAIQTAQEVLRDEGTLLATSVVPHAHGKLVDILL